MITTYVRELRINKLSCVVEENRKCKGCDKIKRIKSFRITTTKKERNSHYCRECWTFGNIPIEEEFKGTNERELIPLVLKDLEFLRKKAIEIGLLQESKENEKNDD